MQLNLEQKRLVESKPNGHALIKGVAGSGKTTIAVHRIPFLLNHYCYEKDDKVLMVIYNKTLVEYMQYLYEKVEKDSLNFYTIFNPREKGLEIKTIDSLIYKYYQQRIKKNNLCYEVITDRNIIFKLLHQAIREIKEKYSQVSIINSTNARFLLEEIEWMKACNYLDIETYQNADRLGRMSYQSGDNPQKLKKNSEVREAIFELLKNYSYKLKDSDYVDFKDVALIALAEAKENIGEKYTHIIIDESQDLTKVQFDIIRLIYKEKKYSSIYFIADTAQSIYSHAWMVNGRNFTSIGFDMTGRSSSLSKNYRTTTQIAQAAYSLIESDPYIIENENFVKPTLIDRQSSYPVFRRFKKRKEEVKATINQIKILASDYNYNEIAIISKNNSQLNFIEGQLNRSGIKTSRISSENADFQSDTVKLLTIHSVKGLEFKVVFILGINQGVIPYLRGMDEEEKAIQESNERRLFYVGMTRAKELLFLSSFGVSSPFINDINPRYLQVNKDASFKRYFQIRTQDYKYSDKINPYSSKESVRQWMINQLIDEYGYNQENIKIDQKLDVFIVDIAIKYDNKLDTVILINSYFTGIDDLFYRIKQFNSNKFNYAIITDGNSIGIYNNDLEKIIDLPSSKDKENLNLAEKFEFTNLLSKNKYTIIRDHLSPKEVIVKENNSALNFKEDEVRKISIYDNIVIDKHIDKNQESESFYLPKEFFNYENIFMLKVKGDSMIGSNIHDGDIVIINEQSSANNWDIIAAVINERVVLKRLSKMGDFIALISENPKYEAISIKEDQLSISGVVIGVMKKV